MGVFLVEYLTIKFCLLFPHDQIQVICLWQEYDKRNSIFFVLHPTRWGIISICLITDNVHCDYLVRDLSYFSTVKLVFFFVIKKYFLGR